MDVPAAVDGHSSVRNVGELSRGDGAAAALRGAEQGCAGSRLRRAGLPYTSYTREPPSLGRACDRRSLRRDTPIIRNHGPRDARPQEQDTALGRLARARHGNTVGHHVQLRDHGLPAEQIKECHLADGLFCLADFILNFIFFCEFAIKFYAYGLAYFKDTWNQLDFVVVMPGDAVDDYGVPLRLWSKFWKWSCRHLALRMMRVLRPLKSLRKFPEMRLLVGSLFGSFHLLLAIVVLIAMAVFCFAVVATLVLWGCVGLSLRAGPPLRPGSRDIPCFQALF